MKSQIKTSFSLVLAATLTLVVIYVSCQYPNNPAAGNTIPETRLANIPVNDTIAQYIGLGAIPEVVLYWSGNDPDGYVIAYKYRWIDVSRRGRVENPYSTIMNIVSLGPLNLDNMIMVKGNPRSLPEVYRFFSTLTLADTGIIRGINDSLATGRTFAVPYKSGLVAGDSVYGADTSNHKSPTRGKFIFDSPADSNMHRFEISSVDNNGSVDPSPAVVNFWTLKSPTPFMTIVAPVVNTPISGGLVDTTQVAIRYTTTRFQGLRIDYTALDQSTFDIVYSWSVDDTINALSWSPWTINTTAFITASSFKPVVSGWHTFYVRAKNRWGVLSNIASARFKAIIPAIDETGYPRRILVYNSTPPGNGTLGQPDTNQVKSFYREVLDSVGKAGKYDFFLPTASNPFPTQVTLGGYSTVIYLLERRVAAIGQGQYRLDVNKQILLRKYLQVGGNLLFVGPADTGSINGFSAFSDEFFHTTRFGFFGSRVNANLDFAGMKGQLGYPNIAIDPAKLPVDSVGSLRNVCVNIPIGFAQIIGTFDSRTNNPLFEDVPIALRFLAPDPVAPARREYSVVHFGFPLYFAQKSAVIQAVRKAFDDVKEQ